MPNVILPADWEWQGKELPSMSGGTVGGMSDYNTYVVAVRNEGYTEVRGTPPNEMTYVAPTVANVAYSYSRVITQ